MLEREKIILHSDLNNFFATVEKTLNPELEGKPMAVCGNAEERHGIVLAKSEEAKKYGIKTAMTIVEAKRLCPELITVSSHHSLYEEYSLKVKKIYERFTDQIESFGIDEAWLDVTHSTVFGDGKTIADKIRKAVKEELGLTCSVGVSFNKVFAKLASDMKKPDATTVISKRNYMKTVWRLPVGDLLYVGKSTATTLRGLNVVTIGDLANTPCDFLVHHLGKWGEMLWCYANGLDDSSVRKIGDESETKSVGNSVTTYKDMENLNEVKSVLNFLCESISSRLIKYGLGKASTITVSVRDERLHWVSHQTKLPYPSVLSEDFFKSAIDLFKKTYDWRSFIRSIGVAVSDFVSENEQIELGRDNEKYRKKVDLENRVIGLRKKYGQSTLIKGVTLRNKDLTGDYSPHDHGIVKMHGSNDDFDGGKK